MRCWMDVFCVVFVMDFFMEERGIFGLLGVYDLQRQKLYGEQAIESEGFGDSDAGTRIESV